MSTALRPLCDSCFKPIGMEWLAVEGKHFCGDCSSSGKFFAVLKKPDADIVTTHWAGCWREHHECAVALMERIGLTCVGVKSSQPVQENDETGVRLAQYILGIIGGEE